MISPPTAMKAYIKLYGAFKEAAGTPELTLEVKEGLTSGELVDMLREKYGQAFAGLVSAESGALVICDGNVTRDGTHRLHDGSRVAIVPAMLGGTEA